MGGDSFPKIRCHRPAQGRFAHLPKLESPETDESKEILVAFLDLFFQIIHRRTFFNDDGERVTRRIENRTEKFELII